MYGRLPLVAGAIHGYSSLIPKFLQTSSDGKAFSVCRVDGS